MAAATRPLSRLPFLASRELAARPGAVLRRTAREGLTVVTVNGKPRAMLIPVGEGTFMDEMMTFAAARAKVAMQRSQDAAQADGRAKMTMRQINAEIAAARRARSRRS